MESKTKQQISERIWRAIGATEEFLAIRYRPGYTPRQVMEIRGNFIYFTFLISATFIAAVFQGLARVTHSAIFVPLAINSIATIIAFINYRRKRAQLHTVPGEWAAVLLFCASIILSRYIYALLINWNYALAAYNISALFISSTIASVLLYNRKIFRTVFVIILLNWIIFIIAASIGSAEMHIMISAGPAAFNILRELFIIVIYIFLSLAVYMNIPIIEGYERKTIHQQAIIEDYNRFLSREVEDKTRELQNELRERKNTEESLRILSEAVRFSPVSICVTDTEGSIVYINRWFESITGYSLDEIRGKKPGPLLNKNLSRDERRAIYRTVQSGGEWRGELKNIKKTGEEFWDRVAISSIRDNEDRITHYVAIQEDITARKKTEEDLAESENRLKERNKIIEKDISIAEIVQKTLLRFDNQPGSGFSVEYRQKCVEKIGGDFFSVRLLPEDAMGIFIGDVSGHGVASALFTSLLKFITDELFTRYGRRPSEFLSNLNSGISGYMSNYFLTGIYSYIRRSEENGLYDLVFANGGHPSPVIVKADNTVVITESRGPLIGCSISPDYHNHCIRLESGDRLFLFTDGVTETNGLLTGNILGSDNGLLQIFRESLHDDTDVFLDRIVQALDRFRGTDTIEDDLLIIGLKMP